MKTTPENKPRPVWSRAKNFSRQTGLSIEMIEAASKRGELPVRVQRFGAGNILHVVTADAESYLASGSKPLSPTT